MTAVSNTMPNQEPGEIEALLPWHAAGTLSARDAKRVDDALASDPALARQYAAIREEYAETIGLNESLGAPSSRAMQNLFAAIDTEPPRAPAKERRAGLTGFFASLSPRTLMASAAIGALAIVLQAGVISTVLLQQRDTLPLASLPRDTVIERAAPASQPPAAVTRSLAPAPVQADAPTRLFVRFTPTARISDITALLDAFQASIVGSGRDGLFQIQFGTRVLNKDQAAGMVRRLESEKIVSMAVPAQ